MRSYLIYLVPLFVAVGIAGDEDTAKAKADKQFSSSQPKVAIEPRLKNTTPDPDREATRSSNIRVDTNLVLINVTVTDPMNRFVTGLETEHFKLLEDKV